MIIIIFDDCNHAIHWLGETQCVKKNSEKSFLHLHTGNISMRYFQKLMSCENADEMDTQCSTNFMAP